MIKEEKALSTMTEQEIVDIVYEAIDTHNRLVSEYVFPKLCSQTTNTTISYAGYELGIPIGRTDIKINWHQSWLDTHTIADLDAQLVIIIDADLKSIQASVRNAVYNPVNDLNYLDLFGDQNVLPLYALLNGDGKGIPTAPDATEFDPNTHTHLTHSKKWSEEAVRNTLINVTEHGVSGKIELYISKENESDMWNTPNFFAFEKEEHLQLKTVFGTIDFAPVNRAIGYFDAAEVWIKPWVSKNTVVGIDLGIDEEMDEEGIVVIPALKPLVVRYFEQIGNGIRPGFTNEGKPVTSTECFQRFYGVGVANRNMIAVHQFTDGDCYNASEILGAQG